MLEAQNELKDAVLHNGDGMINLSKSESSAKSEIAESASSRRAVDSSAESRHKLTRVAKLGVALILLSGVFFFSMLSVPWWPLGTGMKALFGGILFVCVQVSWWVGAALAGPVVVKSIFGWFKKSKR